MIIIMNSEYYLKQLKIEPERYGLIATFAHTSENSIRFYTEPEILQNKFTGKE